MTTDELLSHLKSQPPCCARLRQAALDEIERLRSRVRFFESVIRSGDAAALTEEERDTLLWASGWCAGLNESRHAVLKRLLERLGGER